MASSIYNLDLIIANILFGVSYSVIVSLLEESLSAEQLFVVVVVVGAAIFGSLALSRERKKRWNPSSRIGSLIIGSLILLYGWSLTTLIGGVRCSALDIATISTVGPAVTLLAAAIQQRRGVARSVILLAVVAAIVLRYLPTPTPEGREGNLTILCGVVCMAISTVIVKRVNHFLTTISLLASYYTIALVALPLVIPDFAEHLCTIDWQELSPEGQLGLIYLPTMGMALPLYLLYRGARSLTALHTAMYRFLQPIIATLVLYLARWHSGKPILPELRHLSIIVLSTLMLTLMAVWYKNK